MEWSSVTLTSLGGIANWVDESVTTMLTGVVTPMVASMSEKLMPFVAVCLSIALIWYGWLIMTGAIQTPVLAAARRVLNIGIIVGIAGAGGLYQQQIAGVMLDLPTSVAKLFTDSQKTPSEMMDEAANKGAEIGTRIQDRAPTGVGNLARAFGFFIIALLISIISAFMSAVGMIVLITVKVGMGIVVVLGPLCILALLFEPTRDFFKAWLRQAMFYAIYAGLFMVVFMFIMGMFGMLQKGLLDLTKADQINVFSMLTALIFFSICSKFMLGQVSEVARSVAGGRGGVISVPFLGKLG